MSILGNEVQRVEDPRFLTGRATYVANLLPEGLAHVTFVRSPLAHGRIVELDVSEARDMPGVLAVVTAADLTNNVTPAGMVPMPPTLARPLLAVDVVRFVGEPIVAIVAETLAQAVDASEAVIVDYDPLEPVVGLDASLSDEVLVHPEHGTNVAMGSEPPSTEPIDAEVVVRQRIVNQRVAPCPLEPRVSAAWWEGDRLVQQLACQGLHTAQRMYADYNGLPLEQVHVVVPDVGGGFGAKAVPYPEDLLLGVLAKAADRPVLWAEDRSSSMQALAHGRAQVLDVTLGGTRDGRFTHYRLDVTQDGGAHAMMSVFLPIMTRMMTTGVYEIPDVEMTWRSLLTTTTPNTSYRGAGRPEAAAALERIVDLFAAEIEMDPAEVRRRNYVPPEAFPYTTPVGTVYDVGDYPASLEMALEAAGYDELRAEQARRRTEGGKLLGIGLATYVEITGPGGGAEFGSVELLPEGRFRVVTGSTPYGQGHVTTWAMLASDRLGVPMDRIEVVHGDTDTVPSSGMTGGSRSVQMAGSAVADASEKLVAAAADVAAELLEASAADVVFDGERGDFHVVGTPAVSVGWDRVAEARANDPLETISDLTQDGSTFPFGTHVAVVEVDPELGAVELVRFVAVDDAGTIINPLLAHGQVHGGIAQGVAQALIEEVLFDDDGNPLTSTFADYGIISSAELPSFEVLTMETPTPLNPLGAKGIGESGSVGSTPAVQNAVVDALAHLGVRHIDIPCTAQRVWATLRDLDS
jgi:aerobic carbon-monoxide dehydrogenase large subunit